MPLRPASVVFSALCALLVAPIGCGADGLIGGACVQGARFCADSCVDVSTSEEHCGSCGEVCDGVCNDGTCYPAGAGTGGGGATGGGPSVGGSGGALAGAGGTGGTGGTGTGGMGGIGGTGGSCSEPFDTPSQCGDCETQCSGATPECDLVGGSYQCVAPCDTPPDTTRCDGVCVDISSDADHCGACFNSCPSGICSDQDPVDGRGECQGKTNGHLIAMCMNFQTQSDPQTQLLANSIFLTPVKPARILAYTQYSSTPVKNGMATALDAAAVLEGRDYELTEETVAANVPGALDRADYDVLLVYDQSGAPTGELANLGSNWASAVQSFAVDGGAVVVSTGGGDTSEMDDFLTNLGLLSVTDLPDYTGSRYYVQSPGDAVGVNMVSPFLGINSSCTMTTTDSQTGTLVFVVSDTTPSDGIGNPSVVHGIVVPP